MHSHLIPGIDDGVASHEASLATIRRLMDLGYEKFVTTPHIMRDTYPNDPTIIRDGLKSLQEFLVLNNIHVEIHAAAEYYLDEYTMSIVDSPEEMLTFGNKHLLFETNYLSEPYVLKDFIFKATSRGYRPVLAHPERYQYMTIQKAQDLIDRGVLLQVNLLSLSGFYMKSAQRFAEKLIESKMVSFVGTDCHNEMQAAAMEKSLRTKSFKKLIELPLLNSTI
jgi:protein-tyrosine phosphatase